MTPSAMAVTEKDADEVVVTGKHRVTIGGPENHITFGVMVHGKKHVVKDREWLRNGQKFPEVRVAED